MNLPFCRIARVAFLAFSLLAITACGGGGSAPSSVGGTGTDGTGPSVPPPLSKEFTIGGTVSGLVGQGLTLELSASGTDQVLAISGNGDFVFPPTVDSGARYGVSIKQQPSSPTQRCVVGRGSFAAGGFLSNGSNITDVGVVCGEFAYVTNAAGNTISAFSVDANTGVITSVGPPVIAGYAPYAIANTSYTSDRRYLYVVNGASNDVSAFAADAGSGALVAVPGSPFAAGTKPRAISIYAVINAGDYSPPPQRLKYYLYVANVGSDDVSAYQIDRATGVPTPLSPATYATGAGPSVVVIHPQGAFLYVANTGGSSDISAFQISGLSGGLSPITGSPFPSGSSVSSLAFGASGKFLYAANATAGGAAIDGFTVDPNTGALTDLAGFPLALPSCQSIIAERTGAYLYARTGAHVLGYGIDPQTGALNPLPGFPVAAGNTGSSLSIDPANQFLYVADGSDGRVTGFELNAETGELTPMPSSPFAVGSSADFITTF